MPSLRWEMFGNEEYILRKASDEDGKSIVNDYFAAPVEIGGERKLVFGRSRKAQELPITFMSMKYLPRMK